MKQLKQALLIASLLLSWTMAQAIEIKSKPDFTANFQITSMISTADGSTITCEGKAGDYGKTYLTYNFKSTSGSKGSGDFTGQVRAIDGEGNMTSGSLQGVWKRVGRIVEIHSLDELSDGQKIIAIGTMDLVSGEVVLDARAL